MGTLKEIVLLKNYDDYLKLYTTGSIEYDGELVEYDDDSIYVTPEDELNYVTVDAIQEITGVKTFVQQIGIKNTDGTIDYIKHINNNLLISTSEGTNLLNIDEGLSKIYAFNKELAFKSDITSASGSQVYIGDNIDPEERVSFDSDPQNQINELNEYKTNVSEYMTPQILGWYSQNSSALKYDTSTNVLTVPAGLRVINDKSVSQTNQTETLNFTDSLTYYNNHPECVSKQFVFLLAGNTYVQTEPILVSSAYLEPHEFLGYWDEEPDVSDLKDSFIQLPLYYNTKDRLFYRYSIANDEWTSYSVARAPIGYVDLSTNTWHAFDMSPKVVTKDVFEQLNNKPSLPIGSIITSAIPLIDATVHLLDGSVISQNGIYSDFVTLLKELVSQGYSLTCTQEEFDADLVSTGNCGKFVIDNEAGTIRLPKITKFIQGLTSITDIGTSLAAGLPNITGEFDIGVKGQSFLGVNHAIGTFYSGNANVQNVSGGNIFVDVESTVFMDASRSSAVYGNSNTVQPSSTMYPYYIVLANTYQSDIVIDINNYAAELNVLSGEVANCVTLNTEQIITADKILTNGTNIKSEIGNMLLSDGTHVHVGNQNQNTRINGIEQRPDYTTSTGTTDIALLSDVMTPSNVRIANIFKHNTAVGKYYYTAPSNGYVWIFCTIEGGGKCYIDNITKAIGFGFDNSHSGATQQSMNGNIPCAKGDNICLQIDNKALKALWNDVFINSIGGVQ